MRRLTEIAWLVPLAVHIGYALATYPHLPAAIGARPGDTGTPALRFFLGWLAITGAANLSFLFLHVRLPRFSDRMLRVPRQAYWLADADRRSELLEQLQGLCEAALFCLNCFFVAVYQAIYQGNVVNPVLALPFYVLVPFFMLLPILALLVLFGMTVFRLARGVSHGR